MVGRENELKELQAYLDKAAGGEGSTIFISGEAGIGKTRLVEELKNIAQFRGFQILSGNSMYESLTPFMPIMDALRSGGLESLFAEEAPRVEAVYLVTHSGLLIKDVVRQETRLDPELFSSVLTTLSEFASQSLSTLIGEEQEGALNTLGYKNYRILIESGKNTNLVVIISGKENEFLINDMREIILGMNNKYGNVLEDWDGDREKVAGIEEFLKTLVTSGKYDGIYYGEEDPKARRNLLFENVLLGLVRQAQQIPTIICIDDLHWADPSSLSLMHYISRNTRKHRLIILGTYRPEDVMASDGKGHPLVGTMHVMDREDLYEKMELARLPEKTLDEFLFALLGIIDFTDEFKNRIYKETDGNPLFVIHLVKFLVEEKIIKTDNGTWKLAKDLKDFEIPSKIYNVIKRRLNRLEKEDRKVLDYASIIGEVFNSALLTSSLDFGRVELLERLRDLEQTHRLIHSHNGVFKFDHAKINEVLYNEIPEELRMEYHQIVANSIETMNKDNLDEVVGDLAFHYYQCKNKDKALHYLIKAAEKAKKEYSNEEAIRYYNEALEFEDEAKMKMDIFENIGDSCQLTGDYQKSKESYNSALTLTQENNKIAGIKVKIGQILERTGNYKDALKLCTEALDLIKGEECIEVSMALNQIGQVYFLMGEFDKAIENYRKGLKIAEREGNRRHQANCLNNIGFIHHQRGDYDHAIEDYKRSLIIREDINDQSGYAESLRNVGRAYSEIGQPDLALDHYNKAVEISERIGDLRSLGEALNNIGVLLDDQLDSDGAYNHFEKCFLIKKKIGDQEGIATGLLNLGLVCKRRKDYNQAIEFYMRSKAILEKIDARWWLGESCNYITEAYIALGDLNKAMEYAKLGLKYSSEVGRKQDIAHAWGLFGGIHRKQKMWNEAIEEFEMSLKINREINRKKWEADVACSLGLTWKAKGDLNKAKEYLNKSLDIYEKLKLKKSVESIKNILKTL
jgi:predicted ATPase